MTAAASAPAAPTPAPRSSTGGPIGTAGGRRGWGSAFVRASGVLLAVLLTIHLVDTYLLHDVADTTAKTFSDRWATPVWRALDWVLVVLALLHGVVGLRPVLTRRVARPRWRGLLLALLYAVVAVAIGVVTFVALTFEFF